NCLLCHGDRDLPGKVGERMQPPPPNLHDPRIRQLSDSDLFQRITFGFGRMPPFELRIDYTDRWHIVNYMGSLD
ncbi:MAG: cytochrome c, partial [Desulfuromonadales bacterium]|nr:cytochrome c [Desulfuromonadales bacterium]